MFCPNCGVEERNRGQFCRACGAELQTVRAVVERPDAITASAVTAREEIGRAIATKITEFESAKDMKDAVFTILPMVSGFLESPEEKRLNRIREGVITSAAGLGVILLFLLISLLSGEKWVLVPSGAGLIVLLVGLGLLINGMAFSALPKHTKGQSYGPKQLTTDEIPPGSTQKELPSAQHSGPPSVTEGTTRQL